MLEITRIFVSLFLFLVCLLPNRALAVAINPSAVDVAVEAGGSSITTFSVANDQDRAITFRFDAVLATFSGIDEAPEFQPLSTDLSAWLTIDPAIATIAPGQIQDVTVTINPPAEIINKSVVFGLRAVGDEVDGGAVKIREGVIGLAFVTVGSGGTASGKLSDFSMADRHFSQSDATFYTTITNTGATILKPTGTITIQNALSKTVDVLEINPDGKRINPGQTRTLTTHWQSFLNVGTYWASPRFDSSSAVTGQDAVNFSIFPWWFIGIGVFIPVVVLILVLLVWRKKA